MGSWQLTWPLPAKLSTNKQHISLSDGSDPVVADQPVAAVAATSSPPSPPVVAAALDAL
jgi:hypothetical protein